MNYGQAYYYGIQVLKAADDTDAETDAFYLLEHVTGLSKADYLLKRSEEISGSVFADYEKLINRRAAHEPCQYIIGKTEFMGLPFYVSPAVLIPRQDTETLVEAAIETAAIIYTSRINQDGRSFGLNEGKSLSVLDMCTGSGAIAVSIKKYVCDASVTAVDISIEALNIAKQNAELNHAGIEFIRSDMFNSVGDRKFDIIVSNPPYVTEKEYEQLMPEVRLHEPANALLAGFDGLDFYRIITEEAFSFLNPGGYLLLEIGCEQAEQVSRLLENNGFEDIQIIKDLNYRDRVVKAKTKVRDQ